MTEQEKTRYSEIYLPSDEPFSSYSFDTPENTNVISSLSLVNIFIGTNNSGKSHLLRSLFSLKNYNYNCTNNYNINQFYELIKNADRELKEVFHPNIRLNLTPENIDRNYLDDLTKLEKDCILYPDPPKIHKQIEQKIERMASVQIRENSASEYKIAANNIRQVGQKYSELFKKLPFDITLGEEKRYYVPILRGMRPLDKNNKHINLYKNRTINDYFLFQDRILPSEMIVFTGLELYQTLKEKLLGEPEDRDLVKDFENFLSDKFFNSKPVTLIPKEKGDDPRVVNIKIGNEQQFPIYQLGDGLQNLIIFTFNIFTEKDRCLFFIEEPDMLMHPSLQRSFLQILSDFDQHQYFITSHSNHFLDMTLDFANISVFHFSKIEAEKPSFKVEVASAQDRRILMDLGVQNSSVFLSNSTIWVEGITDRLYLRAYMKKYIQELEKNDPEKAILNNFREDYHYSFVEYQGSNLTHWSFDPDEEDIKKIKSSYVCANSFLIADGDVATKGDRVEIYKEMLGDDKFFPLDVKEIENLIPLEVLQKLVEANFKRYGGDINSIKYEDYAEKGIKVGLGEYLEKFLLSKPSKPPKKSKKSQSNMEKPENEVNEFIVVYKADSGTIKSKINFCEKAIKIMEDPSFSWELNKKLKKLCKAIFEHIKSQNITK